MTYSAFVSIMEYKWILLKNNIYLRISEYHTTCIETVTWKGSDFRSLIFIECLVFNPSKQGTCLSLFMYHPFVQRFLSRNWSYICWLIFKSQQYFHLSLSHYVPSLNLIIFNFWSTLVFSFCWCNCNPLLV
jgi:hypothetical protein